MFQRAWLSLLTYFGENVVKIEMVYEILYGLYQKLNLLFFTDLMNIFVSVGSKVDSVYKLSSRGFKSFVMIFILTRAPATHLLRLCFYDEVIPCRYNVYGVNIITHIIKMQ